MTIGLIGKKIGMTREFIEPGISIPVTVLFVEKGRIIDVITKDKRGYDAIRVGFGKIKSSKLTKQMKGFFAKKSTEPKKVLREFRVDNVSEFKEGNEIGLEYFKGQKFVDVTARTIGKGFAGVMKKYNFSGLRATHGVSVSHRSGGSTTCESADISVSSTTLVSIPGGYAYPPCFLLFASALIASITTLFATTEVMPAGPS